ncbi:MAG: NADH-quinone oxidoreductase subunit NuoB [Campylobacterota bacterium]|nr:NADH-quinone oxidoreductase subunit NuoB [Campylobacterota bacterium]
MELNNQLLPSDTAITTTLDEAIGWARESSLWPMIFGTACCAIEFMSAAASKYDISRFGAEVVRFAPRQADLLIVAGTITYKQAPILKQIYDQMSEPKWVISMGACACSGGFYDNYSTMQGIDEIIPVDTYVGGCPPRPEALLDALLELQNSLRTKKYNPSRHSNFKGLLD